MRLFELIQPKTDVVDLDEPHDQEQLGKEWMDRVNNSKNTQGVDAYGQEDEEDPHMYDKINHFPSDLENDPYYQYVQAIKPYIGSNPFLPRIYVVKLERDPSGKVKPKYKMEKLTNGSELEIESLVALANRLFNQKFTHNTGNKSTDVKDAEQFRTYASQILDSSVYENPHSGGDYIDTTIKDKRLRQAMNIIKNVWESNNGFGTDLHSENIMFRTTAQGPQLVITDPLSRDANDDYDEEDDDWVD